MDKIRAKIDGKMVVGWYAPINHFGHVLIPLNARACKVNGIGAEARLNISAISPIIEFDPSTAAIDTCKDDKHGVRIFGSKGEFQGGDRIQRDSEKRIWEVVWDNSYCQWRLTDVTDISKGTPCSLTSWQASYLEIIPDTGETK